MNKEKLKRGVIMNKEIDINKYNKSITFQNRGIGFTQIGIANEILDLINDLQQENKQLRDKIPYIIQNNSCKYISIEKCKNKVCVNYKIQELQGSHSNVKD